MNTKLIVLALIYISRLMCVAQPTNKVTQTDPHWVAGVAGAYVEGPNGEMIWNTNVDEYWQGVWTEDTNHWRVQLSFSETHTPGVSVRVGIGSIVTNSEGGYVVSPDCKFAKFELSASDGAVFRFKTNAAAALARAQASIFGIGIIHQTQWNGTLEEDFPQQISIQDYPRFADGAPAGHFFLLAMAEHSSWANIN